MRACSCFCSCSRRASFCSNQEDEFLLTYQDKKNKGLFNIYTVSFDSLGRNLKPAVLSKELVTPFNDGPAAVHPGGELMAYSRNQEVDARLRNVHELSYRRGKYYQR